MGSKAVAVGCGKTVCVFFFCRKKEYALIEIKNKILNTFFFILESFLFFSSYIIFYNHILK